MIRRLSILLGATSLGLTAPQVPRVAQLAFLVVAAFALIDDAERAIQGQGGELADGLLVGAGHDPEDAPGAVERCERERHPAAAVELAGQVDQRIGADQTATASGPRSRRS